MLIEQARWLLDYHSRRNDSLSQRSVAILGFTGVVLALVPTALTVPEHLKMNRWLYVSLYATLTALIVTAGLCLKSLATKRTGAPAISRLRAQLRNHTTGARTGKAHVDLAESLLHGLNVEATSPVDLAYAEANTRARWFRTATNALVVSLAALASSSFRSSSRREEVHMSEKIPEPPAPEPDSNPYVIYDVAEPDVDYFEKGADQSGIETRDLPRD